MAAATNGLSIIVLITEILQSVFSVVRLNIDFFAIPALPFILFLFHSSFFWVSDFFRKCWEVQLEINAALF
jgi:hypothetical protein